MLRTALLLTATAVFMAQHLQAQDVRGQNRGTVDAAAVVAAIDSNRDGEIDANEMRAAAAQLAKLDENGDGKLTLARSQSSNNRRQSQSFLSPRAQELVDANKPLAKDKAEERVLEAFAEIRRGQRFANVSTSDGRVLRQLVEATGAKNVVEIGTSTGESAIWLALGLRGTGGKLLTHEIDEERANVARRNFALAGVENLITIIEGDAHETVKQHKQPIDILFLDADKQGYIDYLEKLLPLIRPGGLIIAHNMHYPRPDPDYIKAVTTNPHLETSFLLMEGAGLGVTLKKRWLN